MRSFKSSLLASLVLCGGILALTTHCIGNERCEDDSYPVFDVAMQGANTVSLIGIEGDSM